MESYDNINHNQAPKGKLFPSSILANNFSVLESRKIRIIVGNVTYKKAILQNRGSHLFSKTQIEPNYFKLKKINLTV